MDGYVNSIEALDKAIQELKGVEGNLVEKPELLSEHRSRIRKIETIKSQLNAIHSKLKEK
jgi:hypothetical protein